MTIALNEEANIARALASVKNLADEIIVVDAQSSDRTAEIARQFTDNVVVRPWPGYGPQKNFALEQATGEWVLFLDADEEVTAPLAYEIRNRITAAGQGSRHPERSDRKNVNVFFVRIITEFLGRPLRHLWGTNPRLLRRSATRWDNRSVHEQVIRLDGPVVRLGDPDTRLLASALLHPSHYRTLGAYLKKREWYTARDAETMLLTGVDRVGKPLGDPLRTPAATLRALGERPAKQFLRLFVKKRGFLDGWRGWLWCALSAQYEYMMCKKYLTLLRQQPPRAGGAPERKG